MSLPDRQLWFVEGRLADGLAPLAGFAGAAVLVVTPGSVPGPWTVVAPGRLGGQLGGAWDAVVVDADVPAFVDVLGQAQGLVRAGGWLVVVAPPGGPGEAARARLAVPPAAVADVGQRLWSRVSRHLRDGSNAQERAPLTPAQAARGTAEQARVVERLAEWMCTPAPRRVVLTADRGRGKSAALGLACAAAHARDPSRRIVVASATDPGAAEVLRFAGGAAERIAPMRLARHAMNVDVVLIDEAARLPLPVLDAIVARHPASVIVFATTVHGYEGTGRGFALRFVPRLRRGSVPVVDLSLHTPIRWGPDDPVERIVNNALLLNARPGRVPAALSTVGAVPREVAPQESVRYEAVDRDVLAGDEALLRAVFGLLVQAHYRTTPRDLEVMLDAPNVTVHVARVGDAVVGVNQVAAEGGWSPARSADVAAGRVSVRGHALAECLVRHLGHADAGSLTMARSVRIAVHPDARRLGIAAGLVAHTHAHHDVDLFGTVFGATPGLLGFREAVGYRLVRMSPARGERSGEPSVVMVRPFTDAARQLTDRLVADAARDVPAQVELLAGDEVLVTDPHLADALRVAVPAPTPLSPAEVDARVRSWVRGPRTFESCVVPIRAWAQRHRDAIEALQASDRALVEARVLRGWTWARATAESGLDSPAAAMRRLRRVIRGMLDQGGSLTR